MSKCVYCGKELKVKSHKKNGERKYCNIDCFKADRGCKTFGVATCLYCGQEFQETRDRPNIFCSKTCSGKYYGEQRTELKKIRVAKEQELRAIRREERRVKKEQEEAERRARRAEECDKVYVVCGNRFMAPNRITKCCSKECSRRWSNMHHENRLKRNGKPDMSITLPKLYVRDKGICQICGERIEFGPDSNADDYPSIDHIIPLARGGLHRWDNVQLACRICNSLKRDKIG